MQAFSDCLCWGNFAQFRKIKKITSSQNLKPLNQKTKYPATILFPVGLENTPYKKKKN